MKLKQALESRQLILLDGAMGTELDKRGSAARCESNVSNPGAVKQVHEDYIKAGSTAIITNTLTMNRIFIESHNMGIDVEKANRAGARIARQAIGAMGWVLGNLSSTGQLLEPYGTFREEDLIECYKEQAGFLAEEGVDGFIIETMMDLREAVCALKACRSVSDIPVVACVSFFTTSNGGRTAMGNSSEECARVLTAEGARAVGANCGSLDPAQMSEVVGMLSQSTRLPIAIEPNAGTPRLEAGTTTVFDMDPKTFAAGMLKCVQAGATLVGGCCGTTPDHIRALKEALALNQAVRDGSKTGSE
jgi:5-methyltetrahydrofolate--homocysteine methyltransferase